MSQSRQALILCIAFSLLLLIWFIARLQFIDWNTANLQALFRQTLFGLLLLQFFSISLLFINHPGDNWQDDALGASHILLFPLPFMALFWLTGSASLSVLLTSLALVASLAVFACLIQQGNRLFSNRVFPGRANVILTPVTLIHILLATMVWNFRYVWWNWLNL